jgi:hypothetical protein
VLKTRRKNNNLFWRAFFWRRGKSIAPVIRDQTLGLVPCFEYTVTPLACGAANRACNVVALSLLGIVANVANVGAIERTEAAEAPRPSPSGTLPAVPARTVRKATAVVTPNRQGGTQQSSDATLPITRSNPVVETPTTQTDQRRRIDAGPINARIVEIVRRMPVGGGYAVSRSAMAALTRAITIRGDGHLQVSPDVSSPCFCSAATYLVFVSLVGELETAGRFGLPPEAMKALLASSQPDGSGVWGRWNANGPGTARLFCELGLGRNFSSLDEAQPGDFAKFWWDGNIGAKERGHSVIYLGSSLSEAGGEPLVTFWSANMPGGLGIKTIPRSKIKRALFSRLDNPAGITKVSTIPKRDAYLADMLKRASSEEEMWRMVASTDADQAAARPNLIDSGNSASPNFGRNKSTDVSASSRRPQPVFAAESPQSTTANHSDGRSSSARAEAKEDGKGTSKQPRSGDEGDRTSGNTKARKRSLFDWFRQH